MNYYDFYITSEEYEEAEKNGISRRRLNDRIRVYGWDKQRAITTPIRQKKDCGPWPKIAEQNGINYQTYYGRVKKLGWTEEKAATTPLMKRGDVSG